MRYIEILNESPDIQHAVEMLAYSAIEQLAHRTCEQIAGVRSHRGRELDDWADLDGVFVNLYNNVIKTFPVKFRPFLRKYNLTLKARGGRSVRNVNADVDVDKHGADITLYYDLKLPQLINLAEDSLHMQHALMARFPALVHELTHAFDAFRSKGRFVNNVRSQKAKAIIAKATDSDEDDPIRQQAAIEYVNDPAEINAHFQQTVAELRDIDPLDWDQFVDEFRFRFPAWQVIRPSVQQRLLKRLAIEYQARRLKK